MRPGVRNIMRRIISKLKARITNLKVSANIISYFALLISVITLYFQFFHINHEVKYATLYPILDGDKKNIIFPILLKNTGNQTETILDFELLLEVKYKNESHYKRLSNLNERDFFSILAPNETKKIDIVGNYGIYLFGTIILGDEDFKYQSITEFNNLNLLLKISYLNTSGIVATQERIIGQIHFNKDETIKQVDCNPIELTDLDLDNNDIEITKYSIIPNYKSYNNISFNYKDSTSVRKNLDKIFFYEKFLKSDTIANKEILIMLDSILKPYR